MTFCLLGADEATGQWGGTGTCKDIKYIGDAGYFRLSCCLDENRPELHWDRDHEILWADWSAADEREWSEL